MTAFKDTSGYKTEQQNGSSGYTQGYTTGANHELYNPHVPGSPYVAMKIRDRLFDSRERGGPNFIRNFTTTRPCNQIGTFDMTLCDIMDSELERLLLDVLRHQKEEYISLQYGWAEGNKSPWYVGMIIDYKPQFVSGLGLNLTLSGYWSREDSKFRIKTYQGMSISEMVKQVCDYEGWRPYKITETPKFDEERQIACMNEKSIDFIREKLIPECNSDDGFPFVFKLVSDSDGVKAFFVPENEYIEEERKKFSFDINAFNYGSVIDFTPQYSGIVVAQCIGQEVTFVNKDTNEMKTYQAEGQNSDDDDTENMIYGATSPDKMKALIQNQWYAKNVSSFQAEMNIVGNPDIEPIKFIDVLPFRMDGTLHHTHGTYFVYEVTDTIGDGYKTNIKMVRVPVDELGEDKIPQESFFPTDDWSEDGSPKEQQEKAAGCTVGAW